MQGHGLGKRVVHLKDVHPEMRKYAAVDEVGVVVSAVNPHLAMRQGVSDAGLEIIKFNHVARIALFKSAEECDAADLPAHAARLEEIEFALQDAWNFDRDKTHHEWFNLPRCTCPKMDNREMRGIDRRYINSNCPAHGQNFLKGNAA